MRDERQRDISRLIKNDERVLWNFYNLYNSKVIRDDDPVYPYKMLLFGENTKEESGYDKTYLARSKDLQSWEVYTKDGGWDTEMKPERWQPVVSKGKKKFDNCHAGDPAVVYQDHCYYLAYSSVGFDERLKGDKKQFYIVNCIMGAVSDDLIHWTKSEEPILIWDKEYELGWEIEQPKPHNYGGYHRPSLIFDEEKWKLWFDYYLDGTFLSMGYAENQEDFLDPSGYRLLKYGDDPALRDFPNPSVIKIDDDYFAFADPPSFDEKRTTNRRTVIAHSKDGINFHVLGHLLPDPDEGAHVAEPFYDQDGKLYLFYSRLPDYDWPRYKEIHRVELDLEELRKLAEG